MARLATPPSEESLDDEDPRHVDIEVSADGDDGGGCSGGHHEYGMRPDTALIDLGMVPPTRPSCGMPLRPDIPASEIPLGGDDHQHATTKISADRTDGRGSEGDHYECEKRPDTALLGLGMMPPTRSNNGTPRRPITPLYVTSLDGAIARHVNTKVSADGTDSGGRANMHCEYRAQASMTPLGMGKMPTVHPGADEPLRLGIASSRVYLGD